MNAEVFDVLAIEPAIEGPPLETVADLRAERNQALREAADLKSDLAEAHRAIGKLREFIDAMVGFANDITSEAADAERACRNV